MTFFFCISSHPRRKQATLGKQCCVLRVLFPNKPLFVCLFLSTPRYTVHFILHVTHHRQAPSEECKLFPTQTQHCMGELYLTGIHYIFGQEAGFSSKTAIITEILRTDSWQEEENHPLLRHKSCSSTKQHNSHVPALSQQSREKQRGALCNKPSSRLPRATSNI